MNCDPIFTYQTRLDATLEQDDFISRYTMLYGQVERTLFAQIRTGTGSSVKSEFQCRFGITARQFNAVAIALKGKIKSIEERRPDLISDLESKCAGVRKTIARLAGQAISYRFVRDEKGRRVFVPTGHKAPPVVTGRLAGAMGIDINADCLAVSETNRFGNLTGSKVIGCVTYGKSKDRARAIIGDAVKVIKSRGEDRGVRGECAQSRSRPSSLTPNPCFFAYSEVHKTQRAACLRGGVEVISVDPAYTSVIGAVNYSSKYGIGVHQGAAFAVARR